MAHFRNIEKDFDIKKYSKLPLEYNWNVYLGIGNLHTLPNAFMFCFPLHRHGLPGVSKFF